MITILLAGPEGEGKTRLERALVNESNALGLRIEVVDGDGMPPLFPELPEVMVMTTNSVGLVKFCEAIVTAGAEIPPLPQEEKS